MLHQCAYSKQRPCTAGSTCSTPAAHYTIQLLQSVLTSSTTHLESFRNAVIVPADPAVDSVHNASSVVLDHELVQSILRVHSREVLVPRVCSVQCPAVLLIIRIRLSAHDV
jgi:hypothetical protein